MGRSGPTHGARPSVLADTATDGADAVGPVVHTGAGLLARAAAPLCAGRSHSAPHADRSHGARWEGRYRKSPLGRWTVPLRVIKRDGGDCPALPAGCAVCARRGVPVLMHSPKKNRTAATRGCPPALASAVGGARDGEVIRNNPCVGHGKFISTTPTRLLLSTFENPFMHVQI